MSLKTERKPVEVNYTCMVCSKPARDCRGMYEGPDAYGDLWVYCKPCDAWTAHPDPFGTGER